MLKMLECRTFGEKPGYSGYDRETWQYRKMDLQISSHLADISKSKTRMLDKVVF